MILLKKILRTRTVKASSLIEALIALVILIIITTFIMLIMNNVNNRSNVGLKTRVFNEVNNIFNQSIQNKDYSERNFDFKNFNITCNSYKYDDSEKLIVFKVVAFYSNGKVLLNKQRLVRSGNDEEVAQE